MTEKIPKVVVVGPVFVDMAVKCHDFPEVGEIVDGSGFSCTPAGSGYNTAIQAAVCRCEVSLLSKVGDDPFGQMILTSLQRGKVNTEFVYVAQAINSGISVTMVDSVGSNTGCRSAGANRALSCDEAGCALAEQTFSDSNVCIICSQVPIDIARTVIRICRSYDTKVILLREMTGRTTVDSLDWPVEFFSVHVFIPEFSANLPVEPGTAGVHNVKLIASELITRGMDSVVAWMGSRGTIVVNRAGVQIVNGFGGECVGKQKICHDIFAGALAASCGAGDNCIAAVKFAMAAGEIAAEKFGQPEVFPGKEEIIELLQNQRD